MYSRVSSMLRGSGRMIQRAATTTGSLPLSKSLLHTLLKRVSVSRRKVASFLAGTRYQPIVSRNSAGSAVFASEVSQRVGQAISPSRSRRSRVIRVHQPGSEPIDIPETIPNPVVVPKPTPTPTEPAPKEPVRIPERVPGTARVACSAGRSGPLMLIAAVIAAHFGVAAERKPLESVARPLAAAVAQPGSIVQETAAEIDQGIAAAARD